MNPVSKSGAGAVANRGKKNRVVVISGPPIDMRGSHDKIQWALNMVIEESQRNDGLYPPTNRKPTLSNVLTRAGLPRTFLEKRNQVPNLRDERNEKLKKAIHAQLGNVPKISIAVANGATVSESALVRSLKAGWHEAELNLVQVRADNAALRKRISQTEGELHSLRDKMTSLKST